MNLLIVRLGIGARQGILLHNEVYCCEKYEIKPVKMKT